MRSSIFLFILLLPGCSQRPAPCAGTGQRPLLYLDEAGCLTCNRHFAELCAVYAKSNNVDLVLRTGGAQIDITPFQKAGKDHIRWDDDGSIAECLGLRSSAALFFTPDGRVDTVVTIEARSLEGSMTYITSRLPGPDSTRKDP